MKKTLKILGLTSMIILFAYSTYAASTYSATVGWTAPTTLMGTDCNTPGTDPLPVGKVLGTTVQWRVKGSGAAWGAPNQAEVVSVTNYNVTGLLPETTYEFRIGSHFVGGAVGCWTSVVEATTPAFPPPAGCSNLTVTIH